MARVQIIEPDEYIFDTQVEVRATDLNYGGHVGNDQILRYFQEARVQFYRHLGFESEVLIDGEVGQIITDSVVVYRAESFLGERLIIKVGIKDQNKYGFDMYYHIYKKDSDQSVALGKTGVVFFNYERKKVSVIPKVFLSKVGW